MTTKEQFAGVLLMLALAACSREHASTSAEAGKSTPAAAISSAPAISLTEQEAHDIAKDAYIYAYPLVLTHTTIMKLSNFAEPVAGDAYGPPNQFHHVRALADPNAKVVVRTNVDTLYSAATLDLQAEPQVLFGTSDRALLHAAYAELVDGCFRRARYTYNRCKYVT